MNLEEDHPDIVHQMLENCYAPADFQRTSKFKNSLMDVPRPDLEAKLRSWILLHALADRFLIEGLKTKIIRHFEIMINGFGFQYYCFNNESAQNSRVLSPAGVGRIARAVFETTHDRDTRLRNVTLSFVSRTLPVLGRSCRFVAEVSRIEDFWMLLAMNQAKVDFRDRICPSCLKLDVAQLREHSLFEDMSLEDGRKSHKKFDCGKFRCDSCKTRHTVDEWNALNGHIDPQTLIPGDSEDEESIDSRVLSTRLALRLCYTRTTPGPNLLRLIHMPQQQPEDTPDGVDGEPKFTHAMASTSLSSSDRGTFPLEEFAKRNFQVTGRGTDLAIRCRGKIFHVHSDLLCAKSEFIKKACDPNSPFKKTSEFDFDEEEPLTVWLMLRNCYHCEDWGPLEEEPEGGWSFMALKERLRRSVLAYTIADKYQFLDSKQSEFQVFADLVSTRFDVLRRHETRNHLWNPRNDDFVSEIVCQDSVETQSIAASRRPADESGYYSAWWTSSSSSSSLKWSLQFSHLTSSRMTPLSTFAGATHQRGTADVKMARTLKLYCLGEDAREDASKSLLLADRHAQEARTGVINLNEEHPVMVEAMLEFCYRGEESSFLDTVVGKLGGDGAEAELRFYVHLNAMGDKYQIEPLKYHAFRHFEELASESFNSQYTGYGKPITPAGVARIARDILETTHDTDSSSDYPLRIFFLCELSQRVDTFRRSKRFTAEADRIDGFWETTSKVNAEFGYRLRHCLFCGHLQAEDLRLRVSCPILCRRCGQASNAIAWNEHNSRIDATAMEPDTESEEEHSAKKPSKSKKQGA
ncbi:hypothetical protein BKA80DRAFT_258120 [Phyllosticta citrichinensis]